MKMRKILWILLPVLIACSPVYSQYKKKVLFLGNSYTNVNNLPQMLTDLALSLGDTLISDFNTPGGYTLQGHSTDPVSVSKIFSGKWDYVILQEQSQRPSFPQSQVQLEVYPYADSLNRLIKENDSCTTTMFYMTWGRKNGDAQNCGVWPPVCTYEGMQLNLRLSYLTMTYDLDAECAPAGMAWWRVRQLHPSIELYSPDESHPSVHGTYLTACTFYASVFHKPSAGATYLPAGISSGDALILQRCADSIVFDSLAVWNIVTSRVRADFSYTVNAADVSFSNLSQNADEWWWDFGDGTYSSLENPQHSYASSGNYSVVMIALRNCLSDTVKHSFGVTTGMSEDPIRLSTFRFRPNPASDKLYYEAVFSPTLLYRLDIYDVTGRLFRTFTPGKNSGELDVSDFPVGIYQVVCNGETLHRLMIVR